MGSLQCRPPWMDDSPLRELLAAITADDPIAALSAGQRLVDEAVPVEGYPHPRRAMVQVGAVNSEAEGRATVLFITPGGVQVVISRADEPRILSSPEYRMEVLFGRNSNKLAYQLLSRCVDNHGVLHPVVADGVNEQAGGALCGHLAEMVCVANANAGARTGGAVYA